MQNGTARRLTLLFALCAFSGSVRADVPSVSNAPAVGPSSATIESADFVATVSGKGASITHFVLKDTRYQTDGKQIDLVTTDKPAYLPLGTKVGGIQIPRDAVWQTERVSDQAVRFRLRVGDLELVRKIEVGSGPFSLWSTLRVFNHGTQAQPLDVSIEGRHYVKRADEGGGMLGARSPLAAGGLCLGNDTPERFDRSQIVDDKPEARGNVALGTVDNVYFTQAIAAHDAPFTRCKLNGDNRPNEENPEGSLLTVTLDFPKQTVAPGKSATFRALAYFGPKSHRLLEKSGHHFARASFVGGLPGIDSIATGLVGMLAWIHALPFVGNWGLAIILLTFSVKLILYPLTAKSFQSMAGMRKLKPEIDKLNEIYKDDREKKGAAMMELYRKHKINPVGGCLPQLLQLPIWWALYMSLSSNVELFRRPFFAFWSDLAAPDPYYVLPLALGILMWVQQKMTPSTMDPAQAKMMLYMMPTMITAFMLFLPAGLCLYMFTNSVLSIGQQRFIEYRLANSATDSPSGGEPSEGSTSPGRTGRGRA